MRNFRELAERMYDNYDLTSRPERTQEEWSMWQKSIFEFGDWLDKRDILVGGSAQSRINDLEHILACEYHRIPEWINVLQSYADTLPDCDKSYPFSPMIELFKLRDSIECALEMKGG